ncbi:ASCH domain-containing protein [Dyadobacter bucti]|uniref:ASCH domain-containing protein n=1 Tax=Dyadobacter bucti TaxID=2572203 RepID=UPI001107B544|nr:ASCH domain-containing protein [Dyadobacter bucti]
MKAISIQQPYAGLLILGIKKFETRSWNTKYRGEIAIHASARITPDGLFWLNWLTKEFPDKFFPGSEYHTICSQQGMVIGSVNITDTFSTNEPMQIESLERMLGDFSENRYYWKCENPFVFPAPIPAKGALSFWNWERIQPLTIQNPW